ncbi:type II glyceraldehyde-3-phosphate dehydrogenase [Stetteria hydrogenophila]
MVRVGVNGYGTIGKRVADAILKQDDMELVGVVKTRPDYSALQAVRRGIRIYAPDAESARKLEAGGVPVAGTIHDLLGQVDVIIDATPGGVGAKYKPLYEEAGVKAIFQGGEEADVAEASFSSLCNYEQAVGKRSLRVVSCNTTGLLRLICTLNKAIGVKSVRATLVRRAADPRETKRGPVNSINISPVKLPSHHGEDVKTVLPGLDIVTAAVVVPTTLMHVHLVNLRLARPASLDEVLEALQSTRRIMLVDSGRTGIKSTAELIEAARDAGRPRNDIPELAVFKDSITINGDELILFQAVHQESIVIPENIDAVRAIMNMASREESIRKTDESLGLGTPLW